MLMECAASTSLCHSQSQHISSPSLLVTLEARDISERSRLYADPVSLSDAAWEFAEVEEMLQSAEAVFGPYLWDRFDFILMPPCLPLWRYGKPKANIL